MNLRVEGPPRARHSSFSRRRFRSWPESRVSALEAETPCQKPEIRPPKLQILCTKPEILGQNATLSDRSPRFGRRIHTFPDRSGEISDRSHAFRDGKRDSLPEIRDSGPEFIHSRTEVTPPGTEKRVSSPETRDSGVDPGPCSVDAHLARHVYRMFAPRRKNEGHRLELQSLDRRCGGGIAAPLR